MSNELPNSYLEACGATDPLELSVDSRGQPAPSFWSLNQPYALLGRQADCDVPLLQRRVSARHAYLQIIHGHVFGIDLGSRDGTIWPGGASSGAWLRSDDCFRIGPFTVCLRRGSKSDPPSNDPRRAEPAQANQPNPQLEITHPTLPSAAWVMNRALALVGRSEICRIRLGNESVSRVHCSLVRCNGGLLVVNLCGRGGTRLNSTPIRHSLLRDGDQLQIGEFSIRIVAGAGGSVASRFLVPAPPPRETAVATSLSSVSLTLQESPLPAPATTEAAQLAQTVLLPMVQQFTMMQEQMFHQFRQTLLMMMQMFKSWRDDQVAGINDELNQLQRVTRELAELQSQLTRTAESPAPHLKGHDAATGDRHAPAEATAAPEPYLPAPVSTPADDLHLQLCQRMETLEKERSGHWQNLVRFFSGK